ncbi:MULTISPECIES: hypothetical protein [Burkholderia]|uniref:hypothetical protein n=1 Tax=Burkholderia TaxID=32008 RepID=UPI0008C9E85E|nr:hypothetical protein [Burkholderia cepacia]MBY4709483.1 hypothetical protein [Burkholderia cepacia]MBY4736593.1 hypothetical protein [Burkholderia cepacia]MBY4745054.1 hypothetical protein [Burkholderia cepacia]MBY4759515.1 hypothetical protein [Burkholderia cepacia]MBY4776545.1 hypothetical protein [Burkholderia cepacia]
MKSPLKLAVACAAILSATALMSPVCNAGASGASASHKRVEPPPRAAVATEIVPGVAEDEKRNAEREHGRGPTFNEGKHRRANGDIQRD